MFYECAISPESLFEIAIDRRNYRDFIKEFSTGGNLLYTELPKMKRNKKRLLELLNANHSELQKKRLEDLIIFLNNNKVSRTYDYVGEMSWLDNITAVNRIEQRIQEAEKLGFDGIFISKFNTKGLDAKKYTIAIRPVAKLEDIFSALFG